MATFTIDTENNIAAHAEVPAGSENLQSFATEKELAKLSAEWPSSRLVDIGKSFPRTLAAALTVGARRSRDGTS